jgi:intergrase/recombinase
LNRNLSPLKTLSTDTRLHVLKSLSALAKFLGLYNEFKPMISAYGLKWSVNNDNVILARLTRNSDVNDLIEWVKTVKQKFPDFALFMNFATVTGLRFEEAINAYNLIIENADNLERYYNAEKSILEHFRFKDKFIRRTKKAFMSFVPKELVESIAVKGQSVTQNMIEKRLKRAAIHRRFGELREFFATVSTKHLREVEVDFIQGRVSTSVFTRNYFNPMLITDLKNRVFQCVNEIQTCLNKTPVQVECTA